MVPEVDVLNALEIGISHGQLSSPGEIHVLGGPRASTTVGKSEVEGEAALEDPCYGRPTTSASVSTCSA
jgi:hypothetical protein